MMDPLPIDDPQIPNNVRIPLHAAFEALAVHRRAALGLLPFVDDPEYDDRMEFSKLKSSRSYNFLDNLTVTLPGGYRLCRVTRPLQLPGRLYWEIDFTGAKNGQSHVRAGIATLHADMEAPVGVDEFGYCVRDLGGAFHCARKAPFAHFPAGSTIGFGVETRSNGTAMRVFVNGVDQGDAFVGIREEQWFPAVSIYRDAKVKGRFLRPFKFDPGGNWKAAGDLPEGVRHQLFMSKDIVRWMKVLDAGDHNKEAYKAIMEALTPAHQMPI
jgi:hypothetical protein